MHWRELSFAVAAEDIDDLVSDHVLDSLTGGLEVLPGIEMIRMLREILADDSGHRQTNVRVNVDLADSAGSSLTELLLRDTDGAGHVAAVLIDLGNELLRDGGRTVQHDRETGQLFGALFEHVEPELGLGAGLELVCAVAGADSDGQGVTAGAGREIDYFFGMSVHCLVGVDGNFILNAGQGTEFSFDHDAVIMSVLNDLAGQGSS